MAKSGLSFKSVGGKLMLAFALLALTISVSLAFISYFSGSKSIRVEATEKLAAVSELKTQKVEEFLEMRFSEAHVMTGLDNLKFNIDRTIEDARLSGIDPNLTVEQKRDILEQISENYRFVKQYLLKNNKELGVFAEIKLVAAWDIKNRNGEVIFTEGDQLISSGNYSGNTSNRSMFTGALDLMELNKQGVTAEETGCPFLYSSSFEHCSELNHSSIHMSHGIGRYGLTTEQLKMNSPVEERFSSILIFDIDTVRIEDLLNDATGMGESGLSYMVQNEGDEYLVLTSDRLGRLTALESNVNGSEGISPHMNRNELRRGTGICLTNEYLNEQGTKVLAHNHMLKVGEYDVALITEMDSDEVFQGTSTLLRIISIVSIVILILSTIISILFSRTISTPVKYVSQVMSVLSTGDLTQEVDKKVQQRSDEIGDMTRRVNDLVEKLQDIVSVVLSGSQQIATASEQLAEGNQDLSNRTEQQASALEETSSAIEEMISSIRSNADNTVSAEKLAQEALRKTEEGKTAVNSMMDSMDEINASSLSIADTIDIITNIAFQTNLLALNASIEAARAGEDGKGFAVVAVEVRKLAQRSDKASSEIAEIIKTSSRKVEEGVEIARKAGEMLKEIDQSVRKVTALVGEISAASQEQLSSVDEIDKTITNLDENTQKNAALVEEAASSTEELSSQAQELNSNINFFTIKKNRT
ncbi:methyl-accepting chemotaxis protein [Spirochaeta isovalerica]|uniref:Methyl-accepting chemotaxis protein n=1 Tax=Spirochaeta isovalerica TaxID=150 RepID=A0A841R8F8_9SPIO|nr:methyl-accepting chemotaxis protein [Spirochaeta isovalerica]MBB6480173.1 methyl-accepting chemotaxis protein [Spirochaeta isovalerica]